MAITHEYRVIEHSRGNEAQILQARLNAAAQEGFRAVLAVGATGKSSDEALSAFVIMEKVVDSGRHPGFRS